MAEQQVEDRISNLPDEILTQILSILPINQAIRTSVLSTRWISLWTYSPILDLSSTCDEEDHEGISGILCKFVDSALVDHKMPHLHNFSVCCYELDPIVLKSWISAAIQRKFSILKLCFCSSEATPELPQSLFSGCTLVHLHLHNALINFPVASPACFPKLKVLDLDWISFEDDDSATNLVSSCPILESLCITTYLTQCFKALTVSAPCLKEFILEINQPEYMSSNGVPTILINTPALERIAISDDVQHKYVMKDSSSLVSAEVYLYNMSHQADDSHPFFPLYASQLFGEISHVKSLTISATTSREQTSFGVINRSLPIFCNLTSLEFQGRGGRFKGDCNRVTEWDWEVVFAFLRNCPLLEVLIIEKSSISHQCQVDCAPNLKTIKFSKFMGIYELENLKYFLSSAKVLEKMILKGFVKEAEEILNFPRASPMCEIEFQD